MKAAAGCTVFGWMRGVLQARINHEIHLAPGDPVALEVVTTHPLAVFERTEGQPISSNPDQVPRVATLG